MICLAKERSGLLLRAAKRGLSGLRPRALSCGGIGASITSRGQTYHNWPLASQRKEALLTAPCSSPYIRTGLLALAAQLLFARTRQGLHCACSPNCVWGPYSRCSHLKASPNPNHLSPYPLTQICLNLRCLRKQAECQPLILG